MESLQPCVSIITPCYNDASHIGEAIESALGQTYPRVEVIVVDDGSSDESLEVIRSFGDRIRWETGPNRGACTARNRGLELAQGELVQFLDADDLLHASKLEHQVPVLLESGADLVYSDGIIMEQEGDREVHSVSLGDLDAVEFSVLHFMPTIAPLHRKEALARISGFREGLSCSQERDLHVRLACTGSTFKHLPAVLYTKRNTAGSISDQQGYLRSLVDNRTAYMLESYRLLSSRGELTEGRRHAFAARFAKDARRYQMLNDEKKAARNFKLATEADRSVALQVAYNRPALRLLHRLVGPILTDKIVKLKSYLFA